MSVRRGEQAPGFELPSRPGEKVDVSQHVGREKVVLLFFPLAFSPTCTKEMCVLRDSWSEWENLGAKVFGISVDSPFVTERFRQAENLPFPILSDFNKEVSRMYGVLYEDFRGLRGVSKRAAFVIGRDGTIVYDWVSEDASRQPEYDQLKNALTAA
jgi:peroxiredoxin